MKVFLFALFFTASVMRGLWAQNPEESVFLHPLGPETFNGFTLTCARLAEHQIIRGSFEQEKTLSRLRGISLEWELLDDRLHKLVHMSGAISDALTSKSAQYTRYDVAFELLGDLMANLFNKMHALYLQVDFLTKPA